MFEEKKVYFTCIVLVKSYPTSKKLFIITRKYMYFKKLFQFRVWLTKSNIKYEILHWKARLMFNFMALVRGL